MGSPEPLFNYMVGGTLPRKGVRLLPQGSCWTKPISPSLSRGLSPEGDVDGDKPVPKLLPPSPFSHQKGGRGRPGGKGCVRA